MADTRVKALRRFALSITAFTVVGHGVLGFEQAYLTPIVGVLAAYACELVFSTLEALLGGRRPAYLAGPVAFADFLLPAHITGLACAMLLYGNARLMPTVFAVVVAVASKYIFRIRVNGKSRHFLNPSNAGIALTLVLFPWVGIAPPYHFTEQVSGALDWIVPAAILVAGTMLNGKLTGKLTLIVAWVLGFIGQAVVRTVLFDDIALVGALLPLSGVAFVLYTNYMITDPGTTPFSRRNQVAFGLAVAATYGVLVQMHIVFGLFFALVIVSALRGAGLVVLDYVRRTAEIRLPALRPAPAPASAPASAAVASHTSAVAATPRPSSSSGGGG